MFLLVGPLSPGIIANITACILEQTNHVSIVVVVVAWCLLDEAFYIVSRGVGGGSNPASSTRNKLMASTGVEGIRRGRR